MALDLSAQRIDSQVLERIADLIIGDEAWAPKHRESYGLNRFFRDAGLPTIEHDGSHRKEWVRHVLESLSYEDVMRVITRLASPKEYAGNKVEHASALSFLNSALAVEGIQIRLQGIDPIIELRAPDFSTYADFDPNSISLEVPDFKTLSLPTELLSLLNERWAEAEVCFEHGAYLASTIMLGSILEAVLFATLRKYKREIEEQPFVIKNPQGKPKNPGEWSLSDMINLAHNLKWTRKQLKTFGHSVREYRNLVHPEAQLREGTFPASEDCRIAAIVLCGVARDLAKVPTP